MTVEEYQMYLVGDHWHELRRAAVKAAGGQCQNSTHADILRLTQESPTHLEVHHLTYDNLGDEQPGDTVVVCNLCHRFHHDLCTCCKRIKAGARSYAEKYYGPAWPHVLTEEQAIAAFAKWLVQRYVQSDGADPLTALPYGMTKAPTGLRRFFAEDLREGGRL